MIGVLNPTKVDHSTDTYDTIEWLIKNVPESNGKVGMIGNSYDGFLVLTALVNPHPALKVAVPVNPMVDGWMGDDWFHNGAFRQTNLPYFLEQGTTRNGGAKWFSSYYDDYDLYMQAGSAGEVARRHGVEQSGIWRKILLHPSYDSFWQEQAFDKILAKQPLVVPTMLVHSLWDAEDIYGAIAVYKAMESLDQNNDKVFLVLGPWSHGGAAKEAMNLGAVKFKSDTALHFRQEILSPFLARYLREDAPYEKIPPVFAYETGSNRWRRLQSWPSGCADGCGIVPTPIHLSANQKISFAPPNDVIVGFAEYVSDPSKPVPYRSRPIRPMGYDEAKGITWSRWLVDDQREASGRPDVLTFTSEVLTAPIKISGEPKVRLVASTSGTDSDWIVKIIDVYPDEVAGQPAMGGYQLMVTGDILRGRYRESFETAKPIPANMPLPYQFTLPTTNHVFMPGHRIMVQVQSSWFPLYDRNPQTFVPSIFWAKSDDFQKAVQRIYYGSGQDSYVELPVVSFSSKYASK
jgi:putative CocE/NonD family hydrolase